MKFARLWAQGISDTYALGILAEATGMHVPTVVLPFVNSALAKRAPFRRSVEHLRREGVRILIGPGGVEPHPPHTAMTSLAVTPGSWPSMKPNASSNCHAIDGSVRSKGTLFYFINPHGRRMSLSYDGLVTGRATQV